MTSTTPTVTAEALAAAQDSIDHLAERLRVARVERLGEATTTSLVGQLRAARDHLDEVLAHAPGALRVVGDRYELVDDRPIGEQALDAITAADGEGRLAGAIRALRGELAELAQLRDDRDRQQGLGAQLKRSHEHAIAKAQFARLMFAAELASGLVDAIEERTARGWCRTPYRLAEGLRVALVDAYVRPAGPQLTVPEVGR